MGMPERRLVSEDNRYGFNGKEVDSEVSGSESHYDFGARNYDGRTGRFLAIDPLVSIFVGTSSYSFADNNPILNSDLEGLFKIKNSVSSSQLNEYPDAALAIQRFTDIANHLGYLMSITRGGVLADGTSSSESIVEYMSKTSGLNPLKIMDYISQDSGPTIEIVYRIDDQATNIAKTQSKNLIQVDINVLQALGNSTLTDSELASLTLYWGLTCLHELCHAGDKETNGRSTGEPLFGNAPGKQQFDNSPTGHRGNDMEVAFFGTGMANSTEDHTYTDPLSNKQTVIPKGRDLPLSMPQAKMATGRNDQGIIRAANIKHETRQPRKVRCPNF
jgi:RHS repeat-associated protein